MMVPLTQTEGPSPLLRQIASMDDPDASEHSNLFDGYSIPRSQRLGVDHFGHVDGSTDEGADNGAANGADAADAANAADSASPIKEEAVAPAEQPAKETPPASMVTKAAVCSARDQPSAQRRSRCRPERASGGIGPAFHRRCLYP